MTDPLDEIVAGYDADLPSGYRVRLERDDSDLRLMARHGDDDWRLMAAVGEDFNSGLIEWMLRTCQGELIEHDLGEAWPRCPLHGGHPLRPMVDGWHCPQEHLTSAEPTVWAYGTIAEVPVPPDPPRADGEVRWYLDDLGWGVIAHHEGDLFVLFMSIEGTGPGYRELREGQRVEFTLSDGRQAMFRRAEHVRPLAD